MTPPEGHQLLQIRVVTRGDALLASPTKQPLRTVDHGFVIPILQRCRHFAQQRRVVFEQLMPDSRHHEADIMGNTGRALNEIRKGLATHPSPHQASHQRQE